MHCVLLFPGDASPDLVLPVRIEFAMNHRPSVIDSLLFPASASPRVTRGSILSLSTSISGDDVDQFYCMIVHGIRLYSTMQKHIDNYLRTFFDRFLVQEITHG